jgi:hypothetical protein
MKTSKRNERERKTLNKVYVVTSYPIDTASIGDRRAGIINSIWSNEEKAQEERLRLISIDQEQLFTYEVEEWEVS